MGKGDKGKEPEQDYEFVPPDFDEDAFIHKEMVSFKTTSTLILVGILAAVVSWLVFAPVGGEGTGWFAGLAIVAIAFAALKPLYRVLHFDIGHYGRREWIGTAFLMFFTWLAFFMILLNPPFSDNAPPSVHLHASPLVAEAGDEMQLHVFVVDNDRVADVDMRVVAANGSVVASKDDFVAAGHGQRTLTMSLPAGEYVLRAEGIDRAGHDTSGNRTFRVVDDAVEVTIDDLNERADAIFVSVDPALPPSEIWAVYADLDHDPATMQDRVYFAYDKNFDRWAAGSNFQGWSDGTNNFTIFVEERNRFEGQVLVPGGILRDGPHQIEVVDPGQNDDARPRANPTQPRARDIPGAELPLLLAGVVGAAFVIRRRSGDA